jgi:hypothetical protein
MMRSLEVYMLQQQPILVGKRQIGFSRDDNN